MTINQIFEQLQNKTVEIDDNRYHVTSLPQLPHKLGCTEEGYPKFFVVVNSSTDIMLKNINAELLSVEYDTVCDIIDGDTHINDQLFTIITLRSENDQLQKTFIDVFLMMLHILPSTPSKVQLATKVESLLSIFAKIKHKPTHKLQGLWAELLLIDQSSNPTITARAWHCAPDSKYDFTLGSDKIEVKSTSSESRVHRFSLDQLNPSENSRLLICSIIVRESGKDVNGLSVYDLYEKLSKKIQDEEIRLHVYDVMLDTLGSDFYSAKKKYFDYSSACDLLALYDYSNIPKIDKSSIPQLVTQVKFCADLTHLTDIRDEGFDTTNSTLYQSLI